MLQQVIIFDRSMFTGVARQSTCRVVRLGPLLLLYLEYVPARGRACLALLALLEPLGVRVTFAKDSGLLECNLVWPVNAPHADIHHHS